MLIRDQRPAEPLEPAVTKRERGSALVLAIFVLVLLTGMGTALLFLSETEVKMSQANVAGKRGFYLAEAGLEDIRSTLWDINRAGEFDDDLATAAGANNTMNFNPETIRPVYDANGDVTGFTGYGDDVPVTPATALANGMYIGFLTNDPMELTSSPLIDTDRRVLITGVGADNDGSFEVVQAIIELHEAMPAIPPSTITLLGPSPVFDGAKSKVKDYVGDDCSGSGVPSSLPPGAFVPIVGTVGSPITSGINTNPDYDSGPYTDYDTTADVVDPANPILAGPGFPDTIDTGWLDCPRLQELLETLALVADVTCAGSCTIPPGPPGQIIFVDGDISVANIDDGEGTLVVTGELTSNGQWDWNGLVLVVGEGQYIMTGAGSGIISGAMLVADIAGADQVYGTADDCTGPDGGFGSVSFDESGGGGALTAFCSTHILASNPAAPYDIVEFLQR